MSHIIALPDPRIDLSQQVSEVVQTSGEAVRYFSTPFVSYSTSGNNSVSIPLPANSCVSRTAWVKNTWQFTLSGADAGSPLAVYGSGTMAMRQFPLQTCTNSCQVNFDGTAFSSLSNEELMPMLAGISEEDYRRWFSTCPSMPDMYQAYSDASTLGNARNPLVAIGSTNSMVPRGGFVVNQTTNTNTSCVFTVVFYEPLVLPPFGPPNVNFDKKFFYGLKNISFAFNLNGDLSRALSISSGNNTVSSVAVSITAPPELVLQLVQPNNLISIPKRLEYESYEIAPYTSAEQTIASGASATMQIPSINLQSTPDRIIVYARQRLSDRTAYTSDVVQRINSLSLNFNNRSALLADADVNQLYQISVDNGLQMDFPSFSKYRGSCVILKPKDFGLPIAQASNSLTNSQIQVQASVTNVSASSQVFSLYVWVIYSAKLTRQESGQWVKEVGYLTPGEVVYAGDHLGQTHSMGSGFFGDIWKGVKNIPAVLWNARKPILSAAKNVPILRLPATAVEEGLKSVGLGKKKPGRRGRGIVEDDDVANFEDYVSDR